jgi:hypothetical protein
MALAENIDIDDPAAQAFAARCDNDRRAAAGLDPLPELTEAAEAWRVDGDRTATWALRKIAEYEAEVARLRTAAEHERERIERWEERVTAEPLKSIAFFREHLIRYRRTLELDNPKLAKTYKLPGGTIARTKGRTSVVVDEPDAFVLWALENDHDDLVKMTPLPGALKGDGFAAPDIDPAGETGCESVVVGPAGEVVPGVRIVRADPTYAVKADPGWQALRDAEDETRAEDHLLRDEVA